MRYSNAVRYKLGTFLLRLSDALYSTSHQVGRRGRMLMWPPYGYPPSCTDEVQVQTPRNKNEVL